MKTIQSHDGTEIRYAVCGTGPVNLMFFHGWGGSRQTWNKVIPHFDGARFRSVNLDMRGHGESACSEFGYSWDSFASDALALRLPHMKKRDKSLAILYSLGDAINIVHQTNTGRARKQELGDRSFKG